MLLLLSRLEKRFNYRPQNPWCHNYNFLNTCFECFPYFHFQDGTKGLTASSKIHISHNCNYFLNNYFEYFYYFLLQYGTKDNWRLQNPCVIITIFKYLFRLLFLLHSSRLYNGLKYRLQNPSVPYNNNILNTCFYYFSYFLLQEGTKGLTTVSKIQVYHNDNFLKKLFRLFSNILLQDGTKGLIAVSKINIRRNYNFLYNCFEDPFVP